MGTPGHRADGSVHVCGSRCFVHFGSADRGKAKHSKTVSVTVLASFKKRAHLNFAVDETTVIKPITIVIANEISRAVNVYLKEMCENCLKRGGKTRVNKSRLVFVIYTLFSLVKRKLAGIF